jgi:hypothetical protein
MNQPCRRQTAAGRFSGNLMTKVTVYFRTIRSGFNNTRLSFIMSVHEHPPSIQIVRFPRTSINTIKAGQGRFKA